MKPIMKPVHALAASLLLAAGVAQANYSPDNVESSDLLTGIYSITVKQTGTTPVIRVQSDGAKYTQVKPGQSIVWQASSRGVCRVKRKIRKFHWWLNDNTQVKPISYYQHHKILTRKDWINSKSSQDKYEAAGQLSLPVTQKIANEAVKACNSYLTAEKQKGQSIAAVLAKDKTLADFDSAQPLLGGVVYLQCSENNGMNTMLGHAWQNVRLDVICEASPIKPAAKPAAMPDLAAKFMLQNPLLKVAPANYKGECPVDIEAEGTLKASGAGKVQYRWSHNGGMGPVGVAQLNSNGWKTVSTTFKDIGKSLPQGTLTLSSKLAQKQGPMNPNSIKAHADHVHTGSVQLLSLPMDEQNWSKARQSPQVGYKVECVSAFKPPVIATPILKADLLPGPTLSIANATAPWGSTLAVDASPFQAGKRGDQCPLRMTYDVLNEGTAEASVSQARLFTGSSSLHTQVLAKLSPNAQAKVADTIYLSDGRHTVGVKVDNQDQVSESSETNNMQRITVMVRGCSSVTPRIR